MLTKLALLGIGLVIFFLGSVLGALWRTEPPDGAPWPVTLANTGGQIVPLSNAAIATSAPLGTTFDDLGTVGHILDPRSGQPFGQWKQVSVSATTAAVADGLSTAFCLMTKAEITAAGQDGILKVITIS